MKHFVVLKNISCVLNIKYLFSFNFPTTATAIAEGGEHIF